MLTYDLQEGIEGDLGGVMGVMESCGELDTSPAYEQEENDEDDTLKTLCGHLLPYCW